MWSGQFYLFSTTPPCTALVSVLRVKGFVVGRKPSALVSQLMLYTTFRIDPQDAIQALSLCIWRRTYKYRCEESTSILHGRVMCQTPSRFECLLYSVFTRLSLSLISPASHRQERDMQSVTE